jgi:hypothetical protein
VWIVVRVMLHCTLRTLLRTTCSVGGHPPSRPVLRLIWGREGNINLLDPPLAIAIPLEDIAVRLVCVLALDRFADFVTDEVAHWAEISRKWDCFTVSRPLKAHPTGDHPCSLQQASHGMATSRESLQTLKLTEFFCNSSISFHPKINEFRPTVRW